MQDIFHNLFKYDYWANRTIIHTLMSSEHVPNESTRLMAHILGSEEVWLERLRGGKADGSMIWPEYDLRTCQLRLEVLGNDWTAIIAKSEGNFSRFVHYRNSKGQQFDSSIADVLTQVVTHSSYHRGQIVKLQRQKGEEPVNTDYITYARTVKQR